MTMPHGMPGAMLQASAKQSAKQCSSESSWQSTDGRTYERTNGEVTYVTSKTSLTDTCAHVQDFGDLEIGR